MLQIARYKEILFAFLITYGGRLIVAMILLLVGLWIIKRLAFVIERAMLRHHVDPSLRPFLRNLLSVTLKGLLLIAVVAQMGLEMTSIFAVLGSAGLAVGLALQGSLSNFAGGVLILAVKPFQIGDYIEAQGVGGKVHMINILHTIIKTAENKTIFIPNGPLANSTITNFDMEPHRRTDIKVMVPYGESADKAKAIIQDLLQKDDRVLSEPAPQVLSTNTDTGVVIDTRVWVLREHMASIPFDLQDQIRVRFAQEKINLFGKVPEALPAV